MTTTVHPRLNVTHEQIARFCEKWKITRLELFGSVLRDDFDEESDIDVLVTFAEGAGTRLRELLDLEEELQALLGRPVDLVKRRLVEQSQNWIRRSSILDSAEPIYAQAG